MQMNIELQVLRNHRDRFHKIIDDFPGILLKHYMDGMHWMALLAVCPLSPKREDKMRRLVLGSYKKSTTKAVGIVFSMLTDHLLAEAFRLGLPQVMISRVVDDRRWARKFTKPEYKEEYTRKLRVSTRDLIEAILEKEMLNLDGCR